MATQKLGRNRIFGYEEERSKDDLKPSYKFRIGLNMKYIGTS